MCTPSDNRQAETVIAKPKQRQNTFKVNQVVK